MSPAIASATDCTALQGLAQLECFRTEHPAIYERVEAGCTSSAQVRVCRVESYSREGLTFVPMKGGKATAAAPGSASPTPESISSAPVDGVPSKGRRTPRKGLDPAAVSIATISLTLAGTTLQQVPAVCSSSAKCRISKDEQDRIASFGFVIATEASRIPAILGSNNADAAKITQLLDVLDGMVAKAPAGLSPEARLYIDTGLTATQAIVTLLAD